MKMQTGVRYCWALYFQIENVVRVAKPCGRVRTDGTFHGCSETKNRWQYICWSLHVKWASTELVNLINLNTILLYQTYNISTQVVKNPTLIKEIRLFTAWANILKYNLQIRLFSILCFLLWALLFGYTIFYLLVYFYTKKATFNCSMYILNVLVFFIWKMQTLFLLTMRCNTKPQFS